jgi:dephospho-CoA kinase
MFCVGLTGTIASGKSTVAKTFANLGAKIISADLIAREITTKNKTVLRQIAVKFGEDILNEQGELERFKLREIIFNNKDDKLWLEELLHPLIRERIEDEIKKVTEKYCVIEIPLLIDRVNFPYLDFVLLISSPTTTQISRLMKRDSISKEQALAILNSQPNKKLYNKIADKIILNNKSLADLENQITKLDSFWTK